MVILFIDVIIIRYKYHDVFLRTRLAPVWVFYLCSVVGLFAAGFGVYVTFTGPWTSLLSETTWIAWIGSIAVISLIVGAVLFFIGQATVKGDVSDDEAIAKATG
jgi:H+/Cl- antiporter ClcA